MLSRTVRLFTQQRQHVRNTIAFKSSFKLSYFYTQCRYSSTVALKECLDTIDAYNSDINAFTSVNDRAILEKRALESDTRKANGDLHIPLSFC